MHKHEARFVGHPSHCRGFPSCLPQMLGARHLRENNGMAWLGSVLLALAFAHLFAMGRAAVVDHTFHVGNLTIRQLCEERVVVAVNGKIPGPTIVAHEGDTVIVHVVNDSPYNLSMHWHGVFQLLSAWADGPLYVTQCPIRPGQNYTYKFDVVGQEGTLWWHAHASWLRATVYGAFIILPRAGRRHGYPFSPPIAEVPIVLGEWWNADVVEVETSSLVIGNLPNISNAFMINGKPGDLYPCSRRDTYKLTVVPGKAYLLRIINAALNNQLFFKVAGHAFTVVAVDAAYVTPYRTGIVVTAPGQTVDAVLVADARPGRYYMAALPYVSVEGIEYDGTTTTGIIQYGSAAAAAASALSTSSPQPVMPALPLVNDTATAHRFYTGLTGLRRRGSPTVPLSVDEKMFITFGLGLLPCEGSALCDGPMGEKFAGSMNNVSLDLPSRTSLLEAKYHDVRGVYTPDFPDRPPVEFDYANPDRAYDMDLMQTAKGTRVKRLSYNSVVEVVLQKTSLLAVQNHPMHLHGYNFFVLAQGFGTYNASVAERSFNLVNPQVRNTIAVPTGGWVVIRFVANNPGVWLMHCHLDVHSSWGMAMAFEVENGQTPSSRLPPPPSDLPRC